MLNSGCSVRLWAISCVGSLLAGACPLLAQDIVEFVSGSRLEGQVIEIRKADKEFDFSAKIGDRVTQRTYPFATVHAVTLKGSRHVLTPLSSEDTAETRSPEQIAQIIEQAGTMPPEWFDTAVLEYPETLDLDWPLKPPTEGWNNQKNMGQYIWDIINPNPRRWQAGIKLVHHCMTLHADQPALLQRDMRTLGGMYFHLLQDYSRAAFWLRKAGGTVTSRDRVILAECYWRLGSRPMAMEMLRPRVLPVQAIKLLGDLGETRRAVQLANAAAKTQQAADAFLLAGDALRQAGQHSQAIAFYQRVLDSDKHRNETYAAMHKARAQESIEAIKLFDQLDIAAVTDGTYTGVSTGYNGPMTTAVQVRDGRVASVEVTNHQEKQFYSALSDTPRRIIEQQSVQEVDAVSGATITSQAIVNATARALADGTSK